MQNVDYSRMINRRAPERAPRQEEARDVRYDRNFTPAGTSELKRSNRVYVVALAFSLVAFTGGILAGMKLAEIRNIETGIVKYPEGGRSASANTPATAPESAAPGAGGSVSLANAGSPQGAPGKYLIKIGTFAPEEAERLVLQLNNIRELDPVRPLNCKHVKQTVGSRKLAFTIPLNEEVERKNVFVGCFDDQRQAGSVVNILTSSGLPGTSQAKLYEIE